MGVPKNLKDKLNDVSDKATVNQIFATHLADLAVEAISQGKGSDAWINYMKEIVEIADIPADINTSRQLRRLTFKDDQKDDPWVIKNNIYIVANAVCGMGTTTKTRQGVPDEYGEDLGTE